jgi:hypothetical protein
MVVRVLLVGDPEADRLVQGLGPPPGLGAEPLNLIGRRGDQGFDKPHPRLGEFPHDIGSLVSLLGLQPVDRKDDLIDRFVFST